MKYNCDRVNPMLMLTAGKHGNRMSALADSAIVVCFAEKEGETVRTKMIVVCRVSDADSRDN